MLAHVKMVVAAGVLLFSLGAIAAGSRCEQLADPRVSFLVTLLAMPAAVAALGWLTPERRHVAETETVRPGPRRRAAGGSGQLRPIVSTGRLQRPGRQHARPLAAGRDY